MESEVLVLVDIYLDYMLLAHDSTTALWTVILTTTEK